MKPSSLLSIDEAVLCIVSELDRATDVLRRRHRPDTMRSLLTGGRSRATLSATEQKAVDRFRRRARMIDTLGYDGLTADQIDGYLSALATDHGFRSTSVA